MSTEANKTVVRRYFAELVSQGKLDVADELFTPTFFAQRSALFPPEVPPGPERAKFIWSSWRAAFPDWHVDIEQLFAEEEGVAARISAAGTHLGELRRPAFSLAPPTGEAISLTASIWFTFQGGRIADLEETHNLGTVLQRLGIRRVGEPDPEANKAVVRRIVEEVWNRTNVDAADELFAPNFSRHGQVLGPAGVKAIMARLSAAQPDAHFTIDEMLADGDKVILRRSTRGTYTGTPTEHPLFGRVTPPAGLVMTLHAVNIFRLVDGKVAETWEYADIADLTQLGQQLGVSPKS